MRGEELAKVQARLEHVTTTENLALILEPEATAEARLLSETLDIASDHAEARNGSWALGWFHFLRFQALPREQGEPDLDMAVGMFTRCLLEGADISELPEPLVPGVVGAAADLAIQLLNQAAGSTDTFLLSAAVTVWRRVVDVTPDGHPLRAGFLAQLSQALLVLFERTDELADLEASIQNARAAVACYGDGPDRAICLKALGEGLQARSEYSGQLPDLNAAVDALRTAVASAADDLRRAICQNSLGLALKTRFRRLGSLDDLNEAIEAAQATLTAIPADHPYQAGWLHNLGVALLNRFDRMGAVSDLEMAVQAIQAAAAVVPVEHPDGPVVLSNLGRALHARYGRFGSRADLDAAIDAIRAALAALPSHFPNRVAYLENLGNVLSVRFDHFGTLQDLAESIEVIEAAVAGTRPDDPYLASTREMLAQALRNKYKHDGMLTDLDRAADVSRAALAGTPADSPKRPGRLSTLGTVLYTRFGRTGVLQDLDDAVGAFQAALATVPDDSPERIQLLGSIGVALRARSERSGTVSDLEKAIAAGGAAVAATPEGHPDRTTYMSALASSLQERFERTGELSDLRQAISIRRAIVTSAPADGARLAGYQGDLGAALMAQFERFGELADLDESIDLLRYRATATSAAAPDRIVALNNLANALRSRFVRTGALPDADEAIRTFEAAVAVAPADHPARVTMLSNLGATLRARFERTGAEADLDRAIEACGAAAAAAPADDPGLASYQNNLANALRTRFGKTKALTDLEPVIATGRVVVGATPADHPSRAGRLSNLAMSLRVRYDRTEALADLNEAVGALAAAVAATPADHPMRAAFLINLADMLEVRFKRTRDQSDRDGAITHYVAAARIALAVPAIRIRAARAAAALLATADPERAATLLEEAVLLLPEVAPRRLSRDDLQHAISGLAGLANEAAALTLARSDLPPDKRAEKALSLLEAGRAVLLSQALDIRNDLTELRQHHPHIAAQFEDLRERLDVAVPVREATVLPEQAEERRQLAGQMATILDRIRSLDGFASFGLPPSTGELLSQASYGPIIILNVSRYRSDALLLTNDKITSIELPQLTHHATSRRIDAFQRAIAAMDSNTSAARRAGQVSLQEILEWLWDTAAEPVLNALGHFSPPPGTDWPRVWWVPGGLLSLLPIHAAGYHRDSSEYLRRTVMDRVVSSYAPTVRALRYARERGVADGLASHGLIVAMPTTPGVAFRLDHVLEEARQLQERLSSSVVLIEDSQLSSPSLPTEHTPTKANVIEHLPGCSIAHFACHGDTDLSDPSESRLLLRDWNTNPLTVASLAPVRLDKAQLAYLSACRTALTSTPELIDEAIHLTTAFLLAGFPRVIGTLWEIDDAVAAEAAHNFYDFLGFDSDGIDTSQTANALHHTARELRRKYPAKPFLWAAYVHAGA